MQPDDIGHAPDPARRFSDRRTVPRSDPIDLAHVVPLRIGALVVEPALRRLVRPDGGEEFLEPRVMQVLVALARADGAIVSRDDLIQSCWRGRVVGEDAINRVIFRLRRTSEGFAGGAFRIETVPRVGYRLLADEVRVIDAPTAAVARERRPKARSPSGPARWRGAALMLPPLMAVAAAASLFLGVGVTGPVEAGAEGSIAVLPFDDISSNGANAHFATGLGEEILSSIAEQTSLRVAGRNSAMLLARPVDYREARRRLGVSHLLEGSVRREGAVLRIAVHLVQTSDGMQVWSRSFERPLGDVFAVQDEIAAEVVSRLPGGSSRSGAARPAARTSPAVYDLYLAANGHARRRTYPAMVEAGRLLERAVAIDPGYGPAHARLAYYSMIMNQLRPTGMYQDDEAGEARIRTHLSRAQALAPDLAETHAAAGMFEEQKGRPDQALLHHRRALALDPSSFLAWNSSGNALARLCRPRESVAAYRRAAAIEPLLRIPHDNLVGRLAQLGRFDEAGRQIDRYVAASRSAIDGHRLRARLELERGDFSEAIRHGEAARRLGATDPFLMLLLAEALDEIGLTREAVARLPEAHRPGIGRYWLGDVSGAAAQFARRPMWNPPDHALAAPRALLEAGETRRLADLFDRTYPDPVSLAREHGCYLAAVAAPIVVALRAEGRPERADELLGVAERSLGQAVAAGLDRRQVDAIEAMMLTLRGRSDRAVVLLAQAADRGDLGMRTLADPVFRPLRADPRFAAVAAKVRSNAARERREARAALSPPPR